MRGAWLSANSIAPLAAIFGCAGESLSEDECGFFRRVNPLGFILFGRNVRDPEQVRRLVAELRASVGRPSAPVLIDQEGGRVQRLRPPHWRQAPSMARFGGISDAALALRAARLNARLLAEDLRTLGIDVDCAPVLDVPAAEAHEVIGDRAFSRHPDLVAALGRATCDGLLEGGVLPVVKHIPGHGRALVDSHLQLPTVDAPVSELRATDFAPFRALAHAPWAMTAHVVYTALDPVNPATTSARVISEVIRGEIGFDGVLLSDDLSMKALRGDFGERTGAALSAGCDVVLHCNGDMSEMRAVAAAARPLTEAARERLVRADGMRGVPEVIDALAARAMLDGWLGRPA